jgi:hypothetical protein
MVPVSAGPSHRFAGVGNVIVAMYAGAPEASALADRSPWIEQALRRYAGIGQLVIVDRDASGSLPGREFREASREQADRYRGSILFSACVIEGQGVHHALVRTFLRGLALVAGKDVPVRFFDTVAPAAGWAEALVQPHAGPSAGELSQAVDALRAALA